MNLESQRQILIDLRSDVSSNLEALRQELEVVTNRDATGSESDVPTHEADAGTATFERERDESFVLEFVGHLEEIDRAIEKLDDGTYGICDRDGAAISEDRLIAKPEATLCINCQALEEEM